MTTGTWKGRRLQATRALVAYRSATDDNDQTRAERALSLAQRCIAEAVGFDGRPATDTKRDAA